MRTRSDHLDTTAVVLMLTCCVLWGLQQVVVKMTLPALPPFIQGAVRSAIGAALVWAWSRSRGIALFDRDGSLGPGLAAGLLFGAEFLCIYAAVPLTDVSRISVFIYTAPFVVALLLPFGKLRLDDEHGHATDDRGVGDVEDIPGNIAPGRIDVGVDEIDHGAEAQPVDDVTDGPAGDCSNREGYYFAFGTAQPEA